MEIIDAFFIVLFSAGGDLSVSYIGRSETEGLLLRLVVTDTIWVLVGFRNSGCRRRAPVT
jgi:hypothetical protein